MKYLILVASVAANSEAFEESNPVIMWLLAGPCSLLVLFLCCYLAFDVVQQKVAQVCVRSQEESTV